MRLSTFDFEKVTSGAASAAAHRKYSQTWCKGDGRTRFCGDSCTKSAAAGLCPTLSAARTEKPRRLGAKETEEQGLAGIRAPSLRRPRTEKPRRLGAKETEEQGVAGIRAPSLRRPRAPARAEVIRPRQKKAIKNGTMVRQVHRSGALNWYAMWGRVRISSVLSERSVLQPFC